jgi:hypothetical protein
VSKLLKVATVFAAAVCVMFLPSVAAQSRPSARGGGTPLVRHLCHEQVKARYPTAEPETHRARIDLFRACVKNRGRIPK